jgi:hypothetical protein
MNGWQVLVRYTFASPEVGLVRSQLVGAALMDGFLLFL